MSDAKRASTPENSAKKQAGRFQPGQSGNPAGKPRGARHKAVQAMDLLGRNEGEEILLSVIQAAKKGDMRAAEIILRRIWPETKGRPVQIDLPAIADAGGVLEAMAAITQAAATGEITTDEAASLAALVEGQRRAIETHDLEARIAALETRK
ncbi:DUF5681 domain-containing protein [Acidocella facilis]|uniref:DUF5681 domain-containing protein n=1 Tax=Acidocella facilis TaxID=525 RepID=UPI001F423612|nr:DUF5681 domain-containing protein [Acidocella facilis]